MRRLSILALLLPLLGACSPPAKRPGVSLPATAAPISRNLIAATEPAHDPGRSEDCLRIWRDVSTSMNDDELKEALVPLLGAVKSHSDTLRCVAVVRFGRGEISIWSEKPEHFSWEGTGGGDMFIEPDRHKAPLEKKLFRKPWEEQVAQEKANYQLVSNQRQAERQGRINSQFERMLAYMTEPATDPAPCTRFADLSVRVTGENLSHNIIITDGWDDCAKDVSDEQIAAGGEEMDGKLLIILLPRKNDAGSQIEIFNRRAQRMKQLFPGAQVVPAYLSQKTVETLLRQ
jgi:hypothetical protein